MKQHIVLFCFVILSVLVPQQATAKRAPHMKFDVELDKGSHFVPLKGSAIYSDDSTFSQYDTVRYRYFHLYLEDGKYMAGCEILSPSAHDPGPNNYWKIILHSKDDSLVSNVFRISTQYPLLKMQIGDKGLLVTEELRSVHKDAYFALIALSFLLLTKGLLFAIFFVRTDFTAKALRNYSALLFLLALVYLSAFFLSDLWNTAMPVLFVPLLFIYVECIFVKKYVLPQRGMLFIGLVTTFSSLAALFVFVFTSFILSFGE